MKRYAILVLVGVACGRGESSDQPAKSASASGVRSTEIVHEPCSGGGTQEDANSDGKADIQHVVQGGREVCRSADVDFDGKPDLYTYYDASGQTRRRETDLDGNGVPNMVDSYEGGKLAVRELDTQNFGKIDTWEIFDRATGKRARRERDLNGDGRIDQWWNWDGEQVTIASDRNEDGLPDPESVLIWGPNGLATPAAMASASAAAKQAASAPSAPPPQPLPTAATVTPPTPMNDSDAGASDAGPKRTRR
jgi:hypothetical protein